MQLPPKSQRVRRVLYILARFFFPDPMYQCTPLGDVDRRAAFELRRARALAVEGREHLAALGVYKAGELIRQHNSKLNFDRIAADRARIHVPVKSRTFFKLKQQRGN